MDTPTTPTKRVDDGSRLGIVERLAAILTSLTLQNVLVACILIAISIPAYGVWQLLHDSDLRREIMSYAKEQDMNVPCQVVLFSFSGQNEKTTVISGVQVLDHYEIVVGTKTPGTLTAKEAADACQAMIALAGKLRGVLQQDDARTK